MKRAVFTLVVLALLAAPTRAWADIDLGTPSESEGVEWFRYAAIGIAFAYDPVRWVQANAAEATAGHVVNWRERQSRDLIATCSLQTHDGTEWARLPEELIHIHLEPITRAVMADGQMSLGYEPDQDMLLVGREAIYADDYPVVLLERRTTGQSLDFDTAMTVLGVFTVWRRQVVLLECGYPDGIRQDESAHDAVRDEILQILHSLHFER